MAFLAPIPQDHLAIQPPQQDPSIWDRVMSVMNAPGAEALIGGPMAVVRKLGMFGAQAGPLSRHAPQMWRETNIERAYPMLPTSRKAVDLTPDSLYMADTPELALGQGTNKGVRMLFDTDKLRGYVSREKPLWQKMYEEGTGEYVAAGNPQSAYQNALREIRIAPNTPVTSRNDKFLMQESMKGLESQGWVRSVADDGSIVFRKPE